MRKWQFQEAKAKLSEVSRCAHSEGPQVITRFGKDDLVVLTKDEYDRIAPARDSSWEFLRRSRELARELDISHEELDALLARRYDYGREIPDFSEPIDPEVLRQNMERAFGPGWNATPSPLERLIDGITPENVHGETDWGSESGREVSG